SISPAPDRKTKKKAQSKRNRQKKREDARAAGVGFVGLRPTVRKKYLSGAVPIDATNTLPTNQKNVTSTGYTALDDGMGTKVIYRLEDLVGPTSRFQFTLEKWDGVAAKPLVNSTGKIIGVLAGTPNDEDWPALHRMAAQALEERRSRCYVPKKKGADRRGKFVA
ncbi:hypothetical protein CPC08DRAFT_591130, partial [Agrocybe pediades]